MLNVQHRHRSVIVLKSLSNILRQNVRMSKRSNVIRCAGLALSAFIVSGFFIQAKNSNLKVMIGDYDPVSYFSESGPKRGLRKWVVQHKDRNYAFSSKENMTEFRSNPERYIPQFGAHCAFGMAYGNISSVNPKVWSIVGGKLYLHNNAGTRRAWSRGKQKYILNATAAWKEIRENSSSS